MQCQQIGTFRTPGMYPEFVIKTSELTYEEYYMPLCEAVFGEAMTPDVLQTNIENGGLNLYSDNVLWVFCSEDPW